MAQAILNDEDYPFTLEDAGRSSPRRLSPLRNADRYESPERAFGRYVVLIFLFFLADLN